MPKVSKKVLAGIELYNHTDKALLVGPISSSTEFHYWIPRSVIIHSDLMDDGDSGNVIVQSWFYNKLKGR